MPRTLYPAIALLLVSCARVEPDSTPAPTFTLLPRLEVTQTSTLAHQVTPIETVGPTPTPLTHVIEAGDTLLSVAIRYGVELPDLLLANPGVNPRLLIVGEGLIIPSSGAQGPIATATPIPVSLSQVACYEGALERVACVLTASSVDDSALEGVVALVTLVDSSGRALTTRPAYGSINLILPGAQMPLLAVFDLPEPPFAQASAVAISALQATEIDARFADHNLQVESSQIATDARSANVKGTVELSEAGPASIRLVVLALGLDDLPVGFTVWEAPENSAAFDFDITVSSLGPAIDHVEVLSEARFVP